VLATGCRRVGVPAGVGESRGKVGLPGDFGGVFEEPVAAAGDGVFDFGDAGDGPLGVSEASLAPL
jgi:hypothetical protein